MISSKLDSSIIGTGPGIMINDQMANNRSETETTAATRGDSISLDTRSIVSHEERQLKLAHPEQDNDLIVSERLPLLSRSEDKDGLLVDKFKQPETTSKSLDDFNKSAIDGSPANSEQQIKGSPKSASSAVKKKRKIEETIIDGFSICAFKTWEDLQDEINEQIAKQIANNNSSSITAGKSSTAKNSSKAKSSSKQRHSSSASNSNKSSADLNGNSLLNNSNSSNTTPNKKKEKVKKSSNGQKCEFNIKVKDNLQNSQDQPQQSQSQLQQQPQPSNKSSSERENLKQALQAKELAEKRLSFLQKKLKTNQNDSSGHTNESKGHANLNTFPKDQSTTSIKNASHLDSSDQTRLNGSQKRTLNQDLLIDPETQAPKSHLPSYVFNSNLHRQFPQPTNNSSIHNNSHSPSPQVDPTRYPQGQQQNLLYHNDGRITPKAPSTPQQQSSSNMEQRQQQNNYPFAQYSYYNQNPHLSHQRPPPPTSNPFSQASTANYPTHFTSQPPPTSIANSSNLYYHATSSHYNHLGGQQPSASNLQQNHQQQHIPPSPFSTYPPHPHSSSMVTSMSMGSIPSLYHSPYIITDTTISRQTSIIPTAMDHMVASRYGHHNSYHHAALLNHHMNPYNPTNVAVAAAASSNPNQQQHQSMFYPPMPPTERSFMEFTRNYTGPSHLNGHSSNLVNSLPPPPPPPQQQQQQASPSQLPPAVSLGSTIPPLTQTNPSITANPYSFDRWPTIPFDHHQRAAVSRYNSFYPGGIPAFQDRASYANYPAASLARPPTFPTGLFPPPF